jgi:hypothetical protein
MTDIKVTIALKDLMELVRNGASDAPAEVTADGEKAALLDQLAECKAELKEVKAIYAKAILEYTGSWQDCDRKQPVDDDVPVQVVTHLGDCWEALAGDLTWENGNYVKWRRVTAVELAKYGSRNEVRPRRWREDL